MRDFRLEEMNAAEASFIVPAPEFSWSLSRARLFAECRLAYFFQYYLTQGGWDSYADPLIREAWAAKKELSENLRRSIWCRELFCDALNALRNAPAGIRFRMLCGRLNALLKRRAEVLDASSPDGLADAGTRFAAAAVPAVRAFLASDTSKILAAVQTPTSFNSAGLSSFESGGVTVWREPGIVWREPGFACSLSVSFSEHVPEHESASADLFALAVSGRPEHGPAVSYFLAKDDRGDWCERREEGDPLRAERGIAETSAEMRALENDGSVNLADFIPSPGLEKCAACRYSAVCGTLRERFRGV